MLFRRQRAQVRGVDCGHSQAVTTPHPRSLFQDIQGYLAREKGVLLRTFYFLIIRNPLFLLSLFLPRKGLCKDEMLGTLAAVLWP